MMNATRKTIGFMIGAAFVAFLIGLFAWATSGFVNWNAESWFNYWGKGKVVKVADKPSDSKASVLRSSDPDNSLIHDSEDSTITFALTKLPAPSYEWKSDGLHVWTEGTHVAGGKLEVRYSGYCWGNTLKTFTYSKGGEGKSEEFVVAYDEFNPSSTFAISYDSTPGNPNGIYLENLAVINYIKSDSTNIPLFAMDGELNAIMSGTKITFNNVCLIKDEVAINSSNSYSWTGGCKINITASNGKTCNYTATNNPNDFVTLNDGVYEVDLTKLTFINDIVDVVTVEIVPYLHCRRAGYNRTHSAFGWIDPIYFSISKLATPTGLQYDGGTLTWNAVDGANRYGVFWTNKHGIEQQDIVTSPTYTFDLNELDEGDQIVRVRALGNLGETLVASENTAMFLTAYNASNTVTQLVALTMSVNGDSLTKLVPYGKNVTVYCSEVNIPNKEFGGWYYDDGFSRKVEATDVLSGDVTVYARLTDKKVTEQKLSWWQQYKWYVLIPFIALGCVGVIVAAIVGICKKKAF